MLYQLKFAYWDGQREHPRGSILDFPEGGAPKSAVKVEAVPEPELEADEPASKPTKK